mgnify:CR=1 FL=1
MAYISLKSPLRSECPKCKNLKTLLTGFYEGKKTIEKKVYFCEKCDLKIMSQIEYKINSAKLKSTEIVELIIHNIDFDCFSCKSKISEPQHWYVHDSRPGEKIINPMCKKCQSHYRIHFSIKKESLKVISLHKKDQYKWDNDEGFELINERDNCFMLKGSEYEAIGDEFDKFLKKLKRDYGIINVDEGGTGFVMGGDSWKVYCPYLDGGYIRIQGNWEAPENSNDLDIEGLWIFGNNAFRFLCYLENLAQPEILNYEESIPSFSQLENEIKKYDKDDFLKMKNSLIDRLYGNL